MRPAVRGLILLVSAAAAGTLGVVLGERQLSRRAAEIEAALESEHATRPVVVASQNLYAGDTLDSGAVALREVPSTYLPSDALTEQDWQAYSGAELLTALEPGRPIVPSQLRRDETVRLAELITAGDRAITLSVDGASRLSAFLQPADRIDLMLTYREAGERRTIPLLADIPILAVGATLTGKSAAAPPGQRDITLAVSPVEAATITQARAMGNIAVVLRGQGDDQPVADFLIDADHLRETRPVEPTPPADVEIIIGDRR